MFFRSYTNRTRQRHRASQSAYHSFSLICKRVKSFKTIQNWWISVMNILERSTRDLCYVVVSMRHHQFSFSLQSTLYVVNVCVISDKSSACMRQYESVAIWCKSRSFAFVWWGNCSWIISLLILPQIDTLLKILIMINNGDFRWKVQVCRSSINKK